MHGFDVFLDLVVGIARGAFDGARRQEQSPNHHGQQNTGQRGSGDGAHEHADRKEAAVEKKDVGQGVEDFKFPHAKCHPHGKKHAQTNQSDGDRGKEQAGHKLGHKDAHAPSRLGQEHVDPAAGKEIGKHRSGADQPEKGGRVRQPKANQNIREKSPVDHIEISGAAAKQFMLRMGKTPPQADSGFVKSDTGQKKNDEH